MSPKVEITIRGHKRSIQIEAILDTGFEGFLCLPMDVASWIGAEIESWGRMILADGKEAKVPQVACQVELLGVKTTVSAFVTELKDPLVGVNLLENCQLTVDFDSGAVQLKRNQP